MSTVEERRLGRAGWPSEKTTLAAQLDAVGPADATRAWHAVLELTGQVWALKGELPPRTPRAQWTTKLHQPVAARAGTDGR